MVDFVAGWPSPGFKFAIVQQGEVAAASRAGAAATASAEAAGCSTSSSSSSSCAASAARECLASVVAAFVTRYLLPANTAHNVLVADAGRSVFVLPRQVQRGGGAEAGVMAVALAEICGLAIVYTEEDYAGTRAASATPAAPTAATPAGSASAAVATTTPAGDASSSAILTVDAAASPADGTAAASGDSAGSLGAMTPERYCGALRDFALSDEELRLLADGIKTVVGEATGALTLVPPAPGSA